MTTKKIMTKRTMTMIMEMRMRIWERMLMTISLKRRWTSWTRTSTSCTMK